MTKTKGTLRALLMSALALLMCVSMLIGSTFAWFTDEVTSAGNTIQSGTLDVDLVDANEKSLEGEVIEFVAADNRAQDAILWEPGCTYKTEEFYVVNKGNLALQYEIAINGITGDAKLLEAIEWTVTVNGVTTELDQLQGVLSRDTKSDAIVLSGHMKEEAGNEYQGLTVEGISITVFATQYTEEYDSFNNQYDNITLVSDAEELKAAVEAGGNVMLANDIEVVDITSTVAKNVTTNLYLNGKTISATSTVADRNADGKINASDNYNVFLVNQGGTLNIIGDGEINVVHTGDNMEWNAMTTIAHAYGDITVSNGAKLSNIGGTSMAFALNVYSGGNITVEDSFLGSTYCAMRAFNAQAGAMSVIDVKNSSLVSYNWNRAFWAQYDKDLTVYGVLTEAEATEAGNTIYGSVRHAGMSDSALWVGGTEAGAYPTYVATATDLQAAIDAEKNNIVLVADISGDVTVTEKDGVNITIDGDDYNYAGVITIDGQSVRNTGSTTIKNVNFNAESLSADAYVRLGYQNSARYTDNITVKDCSFSGDGFVAVKSYTGGDKNLTVEGCTVNAGMHSMLQVTNIEEGLTITGCKVYSKNGINLNSTPSLTMSGCTFDVKGYAVRFGVNTSTISNGEYTISESNLSSACDDGDAVIIFRGTMTGSVLTLTNTTVSGATQITNNSGATVTGL